MEWVNRIRWALEEDRLLLAYQEIHSAGQSGHAPRLELLLRMRDEDGRLVLPGAFLPAAERYGLMPRLDRWVIDTAFANFDRLHPQGAALAMCSINLSAASLDEDGFPGYLLEMLRVHGVQPQRVMFEITETAAVRDLGRVAASLSGGLAPRIGTGRRCGANWPRCFRGLSGRSGIRSSLGIA